MRKSALVQRRRAGEHLLLDALCVLALAVGLAACGTVDNPKACSASDRKCPDQMTCDVTARLCRPAGIDAEVPDGRTDGPGDVPGQETAGDAGPGAEVGDVPPPTDAGTDVGTDLGLDVPGSCADDEHCTTEGLERCWEGKCVACKDNVDCSGDRFWCSPMKTCETCAAAMSAGMNVCVAPKPHCDTTSQRCGECRTSADCADASKPICGPTKSCVPCTTGAAGDTACMAKSTELPRCSASGDGKCVACTASQHCATPAAPICVAEKCEPCTTDTQCAMRNGPNPGLCLVRQGGRCARVDEVVYVKNDVATCSMLPASGTAEMPVCNPATGLLRTTTARNVIIMRGPNPMDRLSIVSGTGALTVVGQEQATINPGVGRGIELTAARDVYVQGLTIIGGGAEGVVVEGTGTLRLNRSFIRNNTGGGLVARGGAGYEISNSVFDGNGPGLTTQAQAFGGAALEPPTGGRQGIFRNNTVVTNNGPGVVCDAPTQILYGVLLFQNALFDKVNCSTPAGSIEGMPPALVPGTYRLTAQSPCRDMGHMTNFPTDDIDGDKRPVGDRSDCGADEYRAP